MVFIKWFSFFNDTSNTNNDNAGTSFDNMVDELDFLSNNEINPANCLPMVGGVDIEGNPYGTDFSSMDNLFDNDDIFNEW